MAEINDIKLIENKLTVYDERWFPKIAHHVVNLNENEKAAVVVLCTRRKGETYEELAERVGVSARQLFSYRQNPRIMECVQTISMELFKDCSVALDTLKKKAEDGESAAWSRLYFETIGMVKGNSPATSDYESNDEKVKRLEEHRKELQGLSAEELTERYLRQLKSSARGEKVEF